MCLSSLRNTETKIKKAVSRKQPKIMNKMRTSVVVAVALAAGVETSAYAQSLVKQDIITMALTLQGQASVSTSASIINAGNFSQGPLFYKTGSTKFTQANLLRAIAAVLHNNGGFYSTQASLQLVQGELGGFWNITDPLAQSFPDIATDPDRFLYGSFNGDGADTSNPFYTVLNGPFFPQPQYGYDPVDSPVENWFDSDILNSVDDSPRTSIADGVNEYVQLDTGRHFLPVPWAAYSSGTATGVPYPTTGEYPVGHMQPWGQVYVKDPGHKDTSGNPLCENVTFFFDFEVQECYDCFYLSSYITDATFKNNSGTQVGPPCCTSSGFLTGKGTDRYYMTLDFDNTVNNSFLNDATNDFNGGYEYGYVGFPGLTPTAGVADGLTPDLLPYSDSIRSRLGTPDPYETRFTLNGIVTYAWTLKFINSSDIAPDYIGKATYAANGYGFIGLVCQLITGSATFTETAVKDVGCCDDEPWQVDQDNQPDVNGQGNYQTEFTGWYGPGWSGWHGYFDPYYDEYNPYPYYNIVGGVTYNSNTTVFDLPTQHESPYNPAAALTRHVRDDGSSSINNQDNGDVNNYIFDFQSAP
jgi:hypothetical protein